MKGLCITPKSQYRLPSRISEYLFHVCRDKRTGQSLGLLVDVWIMPTSKLSLAPKMWVRGVLDGKTTTQLFQWWEFDLLEITEEKVDIHDLISITLELNRQVKEIREVFLVDILSRFVLSLDKIMGFHCLEDLEFYRPFLQVNVLTILMPQKVMNSA